ncbi:MAG: hypothetical protein WB992_23435 [Bryobacteraceae bacterium]
MTRHLARRERRAAERKAKKVEQKRNRALDLSTPLAAPTLEEEFSPELIAEANAARERIHRKIGLKPLDGFVSQTTPEPSKRTEINRANSQHSTGPRTEDGSLDEAAHFSEPKTQTRRSSRNSMKHGLASGQIVIPGEDPAAFEALLHELLEEHQPASPTEDLLVKQMAQSYWLTQRALRLQNECFTENGLDEKRLALFLRYQTTHDRAFHKALSTLLRLRSGFVSQYGRKSPIQSRGAQQPARRFASFRRTLSGSEGQVVAPSPGTQFVRQNDPGEPHKITQLITEAA